MTDNFTDPDKTHIDGLVDPDLAVSPCESCSNHNLPSCALESGCGCVPMLIYLGLDWLSDNDE